MKNILWSIVVFVPVAIYCDIKGIEMSVPMSIILLYCIYISLNVHDIKKEKLK